MPGRLRRLVGAVDHGHSIGQLERLADERAEGVRGDPFESACQRTSRSSRPSNARRPVISTRRRSSSVRSAGACTSRTNWPRTVCSAGQRIQVVAVPDLAGDDDPRVEVWRAHEVARLDLDVGADLAAQRDPDRALDVGQRRVDPVLHLARVGHPVQVDHDVIDLGHRDPVPLPGHPAGAVDRHQYRAAVAGLAEG